MGDGAKAFAVLTAFLPGMPLVYSGQESALNHRLKFFDKDVIDWKDYPLNDFYTRLLQLKQHHPAMAGCDLSVPFERLDNSAPESIFSYRRKRGEDEVIVLINLSASPKSFSLNASLANTDYTELFSEKKYTANDLKNLELKPWDYLVLKIK
jgi:glycosidase